MMDHHPADLSLFPSTITTPAPTLTLRLTNPDPELEAPSDTISPSQRASNLGEAITDLPTALATPARCRKGSSQKLAGATLPLIPPVSAPGAYPPPCKPTRHHEQKVHRSPTYSQRQRRLIETAMDRFDVINFYDLTGPAGGQWIKIGGGSFGVVYKGEYLGTPVAIKEVLPNNTYDVEKYFERECVLMKEARHPNIVQYIGLTKSPGEDGRIYIISEFVGGNLRNYIADHSKPFSWRLRISFAMDIARAVAYLHVRKCLHRDLKGENLLITANERVKICDFGFARIAARNEDEMKRISYCGTDGYMSPEILLGLDFSLPSDVFSLGVIFCEIAARHLVDANVFKRQMPDFGLDECEVREMASPGCPDRFLRLCLDCVDTEPSRRPEMRDIVCRLREIELEIIAREEQESRGSLKSVGSVRGNSLHAIVGGSKSSKRTQGRAIPCFDLPSHLEESSGSDKENHQSCVRGHRNASGSSSSEDEDLEAALAQLEEMQVIREVSPNPTILAGSFKAAGHGNPWWSESSAGSVANASLTMTNNRTMDTPDASISPVNDRSHLEGSVRESGTSALTIKGTRLAAKPSSVTSSTHHPNVGNQDAGLASAGCSYISASSKFSGMDTEVPAIDGSMIPPPSEPAPLYHRFTLIRNGTRRPSLSKWKSPTTLSSIGRGNVPTQTTGVASSPPVLQTGAALLPPALMLLQALSKCNVCTKRIGWKPFLDCDDCPYRCHVVCGEGAEPTCKEIDLPGTPKIASSPIRHALPSLGAEESGGVSSSGSKRSSIHGGIGTGSNAPVLTFVHAERRPYSGIDLCEGDSATGSAPSDKGTRKVGVGSGGNGALVDSPQRGDGIGGGGAAARLKRWSRGGGSPPARGAAKV